MLDGVGTKINSLDCVDGIDASRGQISMHRIIILELEHFGRIATDVALGRGLQGESGLSRTKDIVVSKHRNRKRRDAGHHQADPPRNATARRSLRQWHDLDGGHVRQVLCRHTQGAMTKCPSVKRQLFKSETKWLSLSARLIAMSRCELVLCKAASFLGRWQVRSAACSAMKSVSRYWIVLGDAGQRGG